MKKIIAIILYIVLAGSIFGCSKNTFSPHTPDSKEENSPGFPKMDNQNVDSYPRYIVDTDSLVLESTMETANGDLIDIYTDSIYRYFAFRETNELNVLSLSDEMMKSLEQKYYDNPNASISTEEAEQCLRKAVTQYFPEYDDSKLKLDLNDKTGNCLEYFAYIVYEYDGINRVNTASISIAFDGTVSLVCGSHNSPEIFNGSDVYTSSQIEDIVFNYVLQEKDSLALEIYPEAEYYEENGNPLPKYQLYISTRKDLKNFSLEKIIYNGCPCWQAEFSLVSSWSNFDEFYEITNPVFHVNVDAISGEVISHMHT